MKNLISHLIFDNRVARAILKNETATQAAKYFVVGGFCTVFDFSMLYCFTTYLQINYLVSSALSFTISAVVNYCLCVAWVFNYSVVAKRHHELVYYLVLSAIGLGISIFLMWLFTSVIGFYYMLSKLIATFITYWINFGSRKYFLHTRK